MNSLHQWGWLTAITGIATVLVYAAIVIVSGPFPLVVWLGSAFGPLLIVASIGLYQLLAQSGNTPTLIFAVVFNVLGAATFTMMALVQLAVRYQIQGAIESGLDAIPALPTAMLGVQLGLDVAWDIFISVGTFFFALNMLAHPQFGWVIGAAGLMIAVLLLIFNLWTFPIPPAEKGLVDLGPLLGLWYLVVSILTSRWVLAS